MSGEAVVLVGVSAGAAGVALAAGAAYLAVRMVADKMREEREAARREAAREMARTAAWQTFHRTEQQQLERMTRRRAALRGSLESLRLARPDAAANGPQAGGRRGFVSAPGEGMEDLVRTLLEGLDPRDAAAGPLRRLQRQARELDRRLAAGTPPAPQTLDGLRATLEHSARRILEELEQEAGAARRLLERVETLLGETIAWHGLARGQGAEADLLALREHLLRLLTTGEVSAAAVELLEDRLEALRAEVGQGLEQAAIRAALQERLHVHLEALGYRACADATAHEEWAIPGGERVRVALQPGNRLAFQLLHERPEASERPLDASELAFLRAQEQRWCSDLHGLLQRLQGDGFAFQVQLERRTPGETIPLVVVEDAEEWDEEESGREAPRRRRLT